MVKSLVSQKKGLKIRVPVNDTVYITPKMGDKLEQRDVYLILENQLTGERMRDVDIESIEVDGVNIDDLDGINRKSYDRERGVLALSGGI